MNNSLGVGCVVLFGWLSQMPEHDQSWRIPGQWIRWDRHHLCTQFRCLPILRSLHARRKAQYASPLFAMAKKHAKNGPVQFLPSHVQNVPGNVRGTFWLRGSKPCQRPSMPILLKKPTDKANMTCSTVHTVCHVYRILGVLARDFMVIVHNYGALGKE